MDEHSYYAVVISNLSKSFGKENHILQNFSMAVPKGCIYGLLGASGVGKSTIISCLIGLNKWDSGEVLVFGKRPGTKRSGIPGKIIGYMPQEIALYNHLSIKEAVKYYGRLYGMENSVLKDNWQALNSLLQLPNQLIPIGDLSGGHKRRVSLALSLIHNPTLILLDEPTVGLDPLLRESLWNYLKTLVSKNRTTILITTHYTEEAKQADKIGLLRNGKLLVEDSPENLLSVYKCNLLEDVVTSLCYQDEKHKTATETNVKGDMNRNGFKQSLPSLKCNDSCVKTNNWSKAYKSLKRIYGFCVVIFLFMRRYPLLLIGTILVPVYQDILSIICFDDQFHDFHLGVVNHDTQNCNATIQTNNSSCYLRSLSCLYLKELRSNGFFVLDFHISESSALASVQEGKSWGYIVFPANYTQNSLDLIAARQFASNESIDGSRISVKLDYSQQVARIYMIKELYESFMDFLKSLAISCNFDPTTSQVPLQFKTPVYGTLNDPQYLFALPGIMITSIVTVISAFCGFMFIWDYKQGTMIRARVAGQGTMELLTCHIIVMAILSYAQVLICTGVHYFLFNIKVQGSMLLYLGYWLTGGVFAAGNGLLFAIICRDEKNILMVATFVILIQITTGGVIFPREFQSKVLYKFSSALPISLPTETMKSIMMRGVGLFHRLVWPGIVATFAWIGIFVIGSFVLLPKLCK